MGLESLFTPLEQIDTWIATLLAAAPLPGALLLAAVLGLRHASDPDHLVAVMSLVAGGERDARVGARIGAWWGVGHAGVLLALGLPLLALQASLPPWLELGAERVVGVVIVVLALRLLGRALLAGPLARWQRDRRRSSHGHLHGGGHVVAHAGGRTGPQALAIGALHGLAGTGAIVVLLIAALPTTEQALAALAVFAPASVASMTLCTAGFCSLVNHRTLAPIVVQTLVLGLGLFGLVFGLWYAGIG
jgi:hypothetical protein